MILKGFKKNGVYDNKLYKLYNATVTSPYHDGHMIPASTLAAHQPHEGPRPHARSPTQKWRVVCAGFPLVVTLGGSDRSDH